MFCSKCGKLIDDNVSFCPACGNPIGEQIQVQESSEPRGRNEVIVRDVAKNMEQRTINRHQAFGWKLLANQEVNVTETYGGGNASGMSVWSQTKTHIKLTFERNTGMKNYAILNEKYNRYKLMEDEYSIMEAKLQKNLFSLLGFFVCGAICSIIAALYLKNLYDIPDAFMSLDWLYIGYGIGIGVMLGVVGGYIWGTVRRSLRKKKYAPHFAILDRQMDQLASEASAYLE